MARPNPDFFGIVDKMQVMLQQDQLREACCRMNLSLSPDCSFTFLHKARVIASQMISNGEAIYHSGPIPSGIGISDFVPPGRLSNHLCSTTIEMIKRLITCGSDIWYGGLLLGMFRRPDYLSREDFTCMLEQRILPVPVHIWLEILDGLSIDLMKYGKIEHDAFLRRSEGKISVWVPELSDWVHVHLISFTYIWTLIEDWKFWSTLKEPYNEYHQCFRPFWELLEHPESGMRGLGPK